MTKQEFGQLSARIREKLVAIARRFDRATGSTSDEAEDVAQEALVTLWELSEKGYPVRDAEALAVRLTKNICVNHYRKRKLVFRPLEEGLREAGLPAAGRLEEEDADRIRKALFRKLSETQRILLTMRGDYALSLDEIAAATGKPKNSIKTALSTARRQMLEELKKIQ
ncbi:MAG: sigma-70 family RNA polymerase sigma factor [Bacteroidales bacterium]|nr:sigma-70 family RNA polymerase sigma factor [Bacteroidales bacterium]